MAHLPMDDAQILFNDNKQMSWSGFSQVLKQHKGKTNGISDTLIDMMMPISRRMEQTNRPYPKSAQELDMMINAEFEKMPA